MKRKQDSNIKMPAVRKVLISCFLCAAVLVSGFTAYSLMMPAKTATDEQEVEISTVHTHTDDCYRMGRKLVCKSTDEDHIHSEECYEERKILVCEEGEKENKAESNTEAVVATAAAEDSAAATEAVTEVITEAATEAQSIQEATTLSEKASEGETSKEQATQGEETTPKKDSKAAAEESAATDVQNYTDFVQYIEGRGGTIEGVLTDSAGNYISFIYAEDGNDYKTGNYKYELPQGLHVNPEARTGEIKFGNTAVGTFEVDEATGLLILKLGSEVVHYQDVRGTLGFGASMTASSGVEKKGYLLYVGNRAVEYKHYDVAQEVARLTGLELITASNVSREQLNIMYNEALCLLYPSDYEGFGIPILEAQKAGCPVIAQNTSSVPEVIGAAGLMVNHNTAARVAADMAEIVRHLLSQPTQGIIAAGLENAKRFSWDKTYKQMKQIYSQLA